MIRSANHIFILGVLFLAASYSSPCQDKGTLTPAGIRIGERLTYNISFESYDNVGYAEIYAVSKGKIGDADAVELKLKIKTTGVLSAVFYHLDESRTVFANPETGVPLLVKRQDNTGLSVKETVSNYLTTPMAGFDALTLIYRTRHTGGAGSFVMYEGDRAYNISLAQQGAEQVRTDAGQWDTTISAVQGDFLTEHGIRGMWINYSNDESHVPVKVVFQTNRDRKYFRILLAGQQMVEPEVDTSPGPVAIQTPKPTSTPRPTPTPYIDNQALPSELGFQLGEKLNYRVTNGTRQVANVQLSAAARKKISGEDSLLLSASVISGEQGNGVFSNGDMVIARVNPESLVPFELSARLSGPLAFLNQTVKFDQKSGMINTGGGRVDGPVGTHNILSLLYAIRSFNLSPSKDLRNPVNDTRVSVFWIDKAYIFTLRPFEPAETTVNGEKRMAQQVAVKTNVAQLDQMGISVWLSTDETRVPLKFNVGSYTFELVGQTRQLNRQPIDSYPISE